MKGQGFLGVVVEKGTQRRQLSVEVIEVRFSSEAVRGGPKYFAKALNVVLGSRVAREEPCLQLVVIAPISTTKGVVAIGCKGPSVTSGFLENLGI